MLKINTLQVDKILDVNLQFYSRFIQTQGLLKILSNKNAIIIKIIKALELLNLQPIF